METAPGSARMTPVTARHMKNQACEARRPDVCLICVVYRRRSDTPPTRPRPVLDFAPHGGPRFGPAALGRSRPSLRTADRQQKRPPTEADGGRSLGGDGGK